MSYRRVIVFIACFCVLCCSPSIASESVRLNLKVEMLFSAEPWSSNLEKRVERRREVRSEILIGLNGEWKIDVTGFSANAKESYYYDGTNVIKVQTVTEESGPLPENLKKMGAHEAAIGFSQIEIIPGKHPLGNSGVNIPWLAYCSGSYLRDAGRIIPRISPDIRAIPDAFAYKDKTELFTDRLGLPKSIDLISSTNQLMLGLHDERVRRDGKRAMSSLFNELKSDEGTVVMSYRVEKLTNIADLVIPIEFSLVNYERNPSGVWYPKILFTGLGSAFSLGDTRVTFDEVATNYTILDRRFRSKNKLVESIVYGDYKIRVKETNEQELVERFLNLEKKAARVPDEEFVPVPGIVFLLAVLVLSSGAIYFARRSR